MFLNDFKDLIFTNEKVGKMQVVKVQLVGIICFSCTYATYHLSYIFIFNGMNGIDLYRMQVSQEAYQVKHKGQVIRIYVQRK